MMTELEIMKRAKMYIDSLANGTDPLTGRAVDDGDIINNVRISRCLFYVSGVLQKVINNGGEVVKIRVSSNSLSDFYLDDEQISTLRPKSFSQSVSRTVSQINELIDPQKMKKLKAVDVCDWLVDIGMLYLCEDKDGKTVKRPTADGESLGISVIVRNDRGIEMNFCVYNAQAQQFIFDNIPSITEFIRAKKTNA